MPCGILQFTEQLPGRCYIFIVFAPLPLPPCPLHIKETTNNPLLIILRGKGKDIREIYESNVEPFLEK